MKAGCSWSMIESNSGLISSEDFEKFNSRVFWNDNILIMIH